MNSIIILWLPFIYNINMRLAFVSVAFLFFSCAQKTALPTLQSYQGSFDGPLKGWSSSIQHFNTDSFELEDSVAFGDMDYNNIADTNAFFSMYRPLLCFS